MYDVSFWENKNLFTIIVTFSIEEKKVQFIIKTVNVLT